jgi:hypothetical protein
VAYKTNLLWETPGPLKRPGRPGPGSAAGGPPRRSRSARRARGPASPGRCRTAWNRAAPPTPGARGRPGRPRVRSHCRSRNKGTQYVSEAGIKWMSRSIKQKCDRALGRPAPGRNRRPPGRSRAARPPRRSAGRCEPAAGCGHASLSADLDTWLTPTVRSEISARVPRKLERKTPIFPGRVTPKTLNAYHCSAGRGAPSGRGGSHRTARARSAPAPPAVSTFAALPRHY